MTHRYFERPLIVTMVLAVCANGLYAESIDIPNASFESPDTLFADPSIDFWQEAPTPWWYDESGGYLWTQLTGVFLNLPPEDPSHIDNCDGDQAVWLFALPEVELFQDLNDVFEVGRAYHLVVGIIGGGGGMLDGVPIEIRLFYRDAENNKVTVGATTHTYDINTGVVTHFIDVPLDVREVQISDPWAGKNIGVQLVSTLTLADLDPETGRAGGFWDLDNVRLTSSAPNADFSGDSFVNFKDFAIMGEQWLSCTDATADLTQDGCVDMPDVSVFAELWLQDM
ncbi:MAG: hypothetical protein JSU94_18230 [Phycisphaerales bacterium]|nr:MAG: hypothetical protein JSU94_18230 [Phycisphaerales bacterium]